MTHILVTSSNLFPGSKIIVLQIKTFDTTFKTLKIFQTKLFTAECQTKRVMYSLTDEQWSRSQDSPSLGLLQLVLRLLGK